MMRYIEIDARNAFFKESSEKMFQELLDKAHNPFVKKYINTNLKKYFINDWEPHNDRFLIPIKEAKPSDPKWLSDALKRNETIYEINIPDSKKNLLIHIVDYLNTLPLRPISIPVKDLQNKIKQWDKELKKSKLLNMEEDGTELLHDYNNGFKWVKVFGKESLNREGKIMNHCVGTYYEDVQNKKCEIYSLRDKNNIPHVTIEYGKGVSEHNHTLKSGQIIKQIKGNSNQPPKDEYLKYVNDFLKKKYVKYTDVYHSDLICCGLFYQDNQLHKLESMPEGFVIKGDLDLDNIEKNLKLSKGLIINGFLSMENSEITSLPENLVVNGTFFAADSALEYVPKSCFFEKNIDISKSCITKWEISEIKGDFLASASDLTYLPDIFIVRGDCDLAETKINYIENITVEGNLDLSGCKLLDPNSIGFINVKKTLYLPSKFPYVYGEHIIAGDIDGGQEMEPEYDEYDEDEEEV